MYVEVPKWGVVHVRREGCLLIGPETLSDSRTRDPGTTYDRDGARTGSRHWVARTHWSGHSPLSCRCTQQSSHSTRLSVSPDPCTVPHAIVSGAPRKE